MTNLLTMMVSLQEQTYEGPGPLFWAVYLVFVVAILAAFWRVFTKAGEPGWAILVPFYNIIVLLKIVGRPWWWLILAMIPFVNFIFAIIINIDLAKSFGKGVGFAIGLILLAPIFIMILGFGDARYQGPSAA